MKRKKKHLFFIIFFKQLMVKNDEKCDGFKYVDFGSSASIGEDNNEGNMCGVIRVKYVM